MRALQASPTSRRLRRLIRSSAATTAALLVFVGCGRSDRPRADPPPTRLAVWTAIQEPAARYRIDPAFIYALVAAESNFDPTARNGEARGLMQIKPAAWRAVSHEPYEPAVWNWRLNLAVGIDYLAYSRSYLHRKTTFSYPKLLAAFHYGLDYLERRDFDVDEVPTPDNAIYRELWRGNLRPVEPPAPSP